jgi:hypothetical protein
MSSSDTKYTMFKEVKKIMKFEQADEYKFDYNDKIVKSVITEFAGNDYEIQRARFFENNLTEAAKKVMKDPAYCTAEEFYLLTGYKEVTRETSLVLYFCRKINIDFNKYINHIDILRLAHNFNKLVNNDKVRRVLIPPTIVLPKNSDEPFLMMVLFPSESVEKMSLLKELVLTRKVFDEEERQALYCGSTNYDKAKEDYKNFLSETYNNHNNEYIRKYLNSFLGEEFFTKRNEVSDKLDPYEYYDRMLDNKELP